MCSGGTSWCDCHCGSLPKIYQVLPADERGLEIMLHFIKGVWDQKLKSVWGRGKMLEKKIVDNLHQWCITYTFVQVNLCQKLLFLHQLTNNTTTDCSLSMKIISSEYLQNMFWHSEQFWYTTCSADVASFWKRFTCTSIDCLSVFVNMSKEVACYLDHKDASEACLFFQ